MQIEHPVTSPQLEGDDGHPFRALGHMIILFLFPDCALFRFSDCVGFRTHYINIPTLCLAFAIV